MLPTSSLPSIPESAELDRALRCHEGEMRAAAALDVPHLALLVLCSPATMSVLGIVFGCFFACGLIVAGWRPAVAAPELAAFLSAGFFMIGGHLLGRLLHALVHGIKHEG